jgi:lysophospholipase
LIASPLRGELSRPSHPAPSHPAAIEHNLEQIGNVLSQFVRLSQPPSKEARTVVSPDDIDTATRDVAASWSWTAAEAATTEAVLIPFLIHLAAARDDIKSIKFCLDAVKDESAATVFGHIAGGVVNCLESASGKSPLHVASINGHTRSVDLLLRSGALVHLRDTLGHTSLYYVCSKFQWRVLVELTSNLSGCSSRPRQCCRRPRAGRSNSWGLRRDVRGFGYQECFSHRGPNCPSNLEQNRSGCVE